MLPLDLNFKTIIRISVINYLQIANLSFVCYCVTKILAILGKQTRRRKSNFQVDSCTVWFEWDPDECFFSNNRLDGTQLVAELDKKV